MFLFPPFFLQSAKDVAGFGVMFFIVFFAFAQLGFLLFGTQARIFFKLIRKTCFYKMCGNPGEGLQLLLRRHLHPAEDHPGRLRLPRHRTGAKNTHISPKKLLINFNFSRPTASSARSSSSATCSSSSSCCW